MSNNCPNGEALLVLENNDGKFSTNFRKMGQILQQLQYADKEVVIISIVGITRQGKSFLMNLLLMFLSDRIYSMKDLFKHQGGVDAVTKGIYMWSRPFIRKLPSGKEMVVLIMDSQGTFDNKTTEKGNVNIFGLSTIMSSVQIFNVMDNIGEDYLKHLTLFSQFATMACKSSKQDSKTFQELIFLVRDWIHDDVYGFKGGEALLKKVMRIDGRSEDLQKVRKTLQETYEHIHAFLVPDPGDVVKRGRFTGDVKDVSPVFLSQLKVLFSELVSEKFLIPKRISGKVIKCSDVQNIFMTYFIALNENASPTNLVTATANIKFAIARHEREMEFSDFADKIMSEKLPRIHTDLEKELLHYRNNLCQSFPFAADQSSGNVRSEQNAKLIQFLSERMLIVFKQNKEKQQKHEAHSNNSKLIKDRQHIQHLLDNEKEHEKALDDELRKQKTDLERQYLTMRLEIDNAHENSTKELQKMMMKLQLEQKRQRDKLQVINKKVEEEIEKGIQLQRKDLEQQEVLTQQWMKIKAEKANALERQREKHEEYTREFEKKNRKDMEACKKQLEQLEEDTRRKRRLLEEQDEESRRNLARVEERRRDLQRALVEEQEKKKEREHQEKVDKLTEKEGGCTIS